MKEVTAESQAGFAGQAGGWLVQSSFRAQGQKAAAFCDFLQAHLKLLTLVIQKPRSA